MTAWPVILQPRETGTATAKVAHTAAAARNVCKTLDSQILTVQCQDALNIILRVHFLQETIISFAMVMKGSVAIFMHYFVTHYGFSSQANTYGRCLCSLESCLGTGEEPEAQDGTRLPHRPLAAGLKD